MRGGKGEAMLIWEGRCGRGAVRRENQDNLLAGGRWREDAASPALFSLSGAAPQGLFAVCDGMGGEQFGAQAALEAVRALAPVGPEAFSRSGTELLRGVNDALCRLMRSRDARIGSTFAGLWAYGGRAGALNLGDSRVYLLRGGQLRQLSRDHTQARQLVDLGLLSPAQAAAHPGRSRLTQHLGIFPEELLIEPEDTGPFPLESGDLFLLCSDGLTGPVEDAALAGILTQRASLGERADALYQAAMAQGGRDNITALLVEYRAAPGE